MIRCIRLWSGKDEQSHFEEGWIALAPGAHGDLLSGKMPVTSVSFQTTASGGTLDFQTRANKHFILKPGIVLLAEDTVGGGHSWKLVDADPWRRLYVILAPGVEVPFTAGELP